jgi:three-Cys-motif partner protein
MPKVDFSLYAGREQAYIKHCLLADYLSGWSYRVGSVWDRLVYVDGFAGPWGSQHSDHADSSFGIAVSVMREAIKGLADARQKDAKGLAIFVEKQPVAFAKLQEYAGKESTQTVKTCALRGRFTENIPAIQKLISEEVGKPFKFVFLDQKGWAGAPMSKLQSFLTERSCEVLFNLMTSFLTRFVDTEDRAESYRSLFGRDGVLDKIRALPKGTGEREEAAVREYCISLRELCGFKYVSEAVILKPGTEKVLYYLVFATNHPKGVEVFKNAEMKASQLQDEIRYESRIEATNQPELLFGGQAPKSIVASKLHDRYLAKAKRKIVEALVSTSDTGAEFSQLFCEAMAFPLVTPRDLSGWLDEWKKRRWIDYRFAQKDGEKRKKPSADREDRVLVLQRAQLKALMNAS